MNGFDRRSPRYVVDKSIAAILLPIGQAISRDAIGRWPRKVTDNRLDCSGKVGPAYCDGFEVRAGAEDDVCFRGERHVHEDGSSCQGAERRQRVGFSTRELTTKFC